jgi:Fur family ferric uptake transcriptional regulator
MDSDPPESPLIPTREEVRFTAFLRRRKLKLTSERIAILAAILSHGRHFDAETLHAHLRNQGGDISRATVYRTLDLLVQCGLVRKSNLGSSHANYEATQENEHHDHLICLNCDKVIEFFRPDLEQIQEQTCTQYGFKPMHHSLQIFGLCDACQDKANEARAAQRVAQLHT